MRILIRNQLSFSVLHPVPSALGVLYGICETKGEDDADQFDTRYAKCDTTKHGSSVTEKLLYLLDATLVVYIRGAIYSLGIAAATPWDGAIEVGTVVIKVGRRVNAATLKARLNDVYHFPVSAVGPIILKGVGISRPNVDAVGVRILEDDETEYCHCYLHDENRQHQRCKGDSHAMTLPNGTAASEEGYHEDDGADDD